MNTIQDIQLFERTIGRFGYELTQIQVRLNKHRFKKKNCMWLVLDYKLRYYNMEYSMYNHLLGLSFENIVRYPVGIQPKKKKKKNIK